MNQNQKILVALVVSFIALCVINYKVQSGMHGASVEVLDIIFGGFPLTHLVILGGGTALVKWLLDKLS
jgi:hypothetical protein